MLVAHVLRQKGSRIVSVKPDDKIAEAAQTLNRERIGAVLVRDGAGDVRGILSERDLVRGMARHGEGVFAMRVRDLMTGQVTVCTPDDTVDHVMAVMTAGRFRHLPVLRERELIGVISIGDVVKARIEETEAEARAMRDYIATG